MVKWFNGLMVKVEVVEVVKNEPRVNIRYKIIG
jgi:hypothetical protein